MFQIIAMLLFSVLFVVVGMLQFGRPGRPFVGVLLLFCALLTIGYGIELLRKHLAAGEAAASTTATGSA